MEMLMIILFLLLLFVTVFMYLRQRKQIRLLKMEVEHYRQQQENLQQEDNKQKDDKQEDTPPTSTITITTLDEQLRQKIVQQIEQNIDQADYGVEQLSDALGMHRASLYKKVTQLTGKTPQLLIRAIRLKRAQHMFDQGETHIAHVAYAVGFNSTKVFTKRFKEEFGETPTDYIARHC